MLQSKAALEKQCQESCLIPLNVIESQIVKAGRNCSSSRGRNEAWTDDLGRWNALELPVCSRARTRTDQSEAQGHPHQDLEVQALHRLYLLWSYAYVLYWCLHNGLLCEDGSFLNWLLIPRWGSAYPEKRMHGASRAQHHRTRGSWRNQCSLPSLGPFREHRNARTPISVYTEVTAFFFFFSLVTQALGFRVIWAGSVRIIQSQTDKYNETKRTAHERGLFWRSLCWAFLAFVDIHRD